MVVRSKGVPIAVAEAVVAVGTIPARGFVVVRARSAGAATAAHVR